MTTINVGEYGLDYAIATLYDMSAAMSVTLMFVRPDGTLFTGVYPGAVTIPAVPRVTTDGNGTFPASQYCVYPFVAGDLNQFGTYTGRVVYLDATKRLVSDPFSFYVNP